MAPRKRRQSCEKKTRGLFRGNFSEKAKEKKKRMNL